jgi:hypothetical protein
MHYRPPELLRIKNAIRASLTTVSGQIQARTPAIGPRSAKRQSIMPTLKLKMRGLRMSAVRRFSSAFTPSPESAQSPKQSPSSRPFLQPRNSRRRTPRVDGSIQRANTTHSSSKTYSFLSYYKSELPGRESPPPVPDLPRDLYLDIGGKRTSNELGQKIEHDTVDEAIHILRGGQRDDEDIPFNDTGTVRTSFSRENCMSVTVSIHSR